MAKTSAGAAGPTGTLSGHKTADRIKAEGMLDSLGCERTAALWIKRHRERMKALRDVILDRTGLFPELDARGALLTIESELGGEAGGA